MTQGFEVAVIALALAGEPATPASGAAPMQRPVIGQRLRVDFNAREPGSRPGVTLLRPVRRTGAITAMDSASLDLEIGPAKPAVHVRFEDIDGMAVSRGKSQREGMLYGAAYGGAIGLAIGIAFNALAFDRLDPDRDELGVMGVMLFSAGGAAVGGFHGSRVGREAWEPIPVRSLWASN